MRLKSIALVGFFFLLSGCINFTSPARSSKLDGTQAYWFDYDASRRGAFMVPNGTKMRVCAEPPPDVALSLVSKLDTTVKKDGVGEAEGKAEFNTTVVKLAERTQMVMLLRESLYRLCEQSLGQEFTADQFLTAYKATVKAAADLAKADAEKAKDDRVKSETVQTLVNQGKTPAEIRALINP